MNIPLLEESPEEAKRKFQLYKAALMKNAFAEFRIAMRAYREMAKGKPLIDLATAFESITLDDNNRPNLAIARADRKEVEVSGAWNNSFEFQSKFDWPRSGARDLCIRVPCAQLEGRRTATGYAMVPMIPPECIPKFKIEGYFILWEVEAWADRARTAKPDRDPLLLRHLAGTLYAVEAAWDLTELERAIMAGLRRTA